MYNVYMYSSTMYSVLLFIIIVVIVIIMSSIIKFAFALTFNLYRVILVMVNYIY